jgi:alpha-L-rhamnosidase
MYGRIESNWRLEDDNFHLAVTIPPNTEGIVHLLAQSVEYITEQEQSLNQVTGIRKIRKQGETVILTIGSGCYRFRVYRPRR